MRLAESDPQADRASQKLALLLPVGGLLLMLVVMLYYLPLSADVTPDEARLMWLVRDVVDIQPAPPRELARNLLQNVTSVVDRSREAGIFPLYPLVLEGWTWLVGDSIEMARVLTMLSIMVGLALFYRLVQRIVPVLALPTLLVIGMSLPLINETWAFRMITLTLVVLVFLICQHHLFSEPRPQPTQTLQDRWLVIVEAIVAVQVIMYAFVFDVPQDWNNAISRYMNTRNPLHPVLTAFTPDSVSGYYAYRYGLSQGVAVDLAWREFSPDEIAVIVEKLMPGETSIWIIMPDDSPVATQVVAILSESHTLGYSDQITDIVFYRFDVTTSTD